MADKHPPQNGTRPDLDAANRPRGWFLAAAAAGIVGGTLATVTAFLPQWAPAFAGGAVFIGALIGALLMRRARDQEIIAVIGEEDEQSADELWELRDIAEHYRRNAIDRRQAEAASLAKSQFLATVSHELRTPLSGILGLAEILGETSLDPEQETFTRSIRTSGELMLGLVDDMLDFAKIEADRFELAPTEVPLEALLEEVTELFFSRAEAKGLDLAAYADPALPERVLADPARLRQVLINLIGNALKFTETGGVAVIAAVKDGRVEIRVEDTGPGIPEGEAERIFDEYAQAVADPRHRVAGSGLGLAIAQRIVQRMGGTITATPRAGGGTVFAFALAVPAVPSIPSDRPDLAGRRVLIVSRDSPASAVLARDFIDCGADVRIAEGLTQAAGLTGAAVAAGEPYDLALVDGHAVAEPGAALATIREAAGGALPAAVIVPPGRHGLVDGLKSAGFNAYLVRPVRRRSLCRIAEGLVSGASDFGRDPRDERPAPRKPIRAGRKLKVLVAEDDPINALLLRTMLQRLDHQVTEASDGETALQHLLGETFDVALLDLSLPGRDGLSIVEAVVSARTKRAIPCRLIAVTADMRDETRDLAIATGFDDFALKPLGPAGLHDLLQRGGFESRAA